MSVVLFLLLRRPFRRAIANALLVALNARVPLKGSVGALCCRPSRAAVVAFYILLMKDVFGCSYVLMKLC